MARSSAAKRLVFSLVAVAIFFGVRDVVDLRAREGADAPRDIFIIHVGNNEFIEAISDRILEKRGVPFAEALDRALERSRLYLGLKQARIRARHRELEPDTFSTRDL